jgi:hypothetical protein
VHVNCSISVSSPPVDFSPPSSKASRGRLSSSHFTKKQAADAGWLNEWNGKVNGNSAQQLCQLPCLQLLIGIEKEADSLHN